MIARTLFTLLLGLCTLTFVGCDSNDDDDAPYLGVWEAIEEDVDGEVSRTFLVVDDEELTLHFLIDSEPDLDACYSQSRVTVVSRDGEVWTVRDALGEESTATVRLDGDRLTVTADGDIVRFDRSDRRESSFTPGCLF